MIRVSTFHLAAALFLGAPLALSAQPGTNTTQWPDGQPGDDFNVTDANGFKQGRWIRVYPDGQLYYSGSFLDSKPVNHEDQKRYSMRLNYNE